MFVRAWEREGNYCTAWVLCRYCNNTERSDPFDSIHREKFVSPEKKRRQKNCINSLLGVLLMEKKLCFLKLISSMGTDNFLCLIFKKNLFLLRQSRICLPDAVNNLWGLFQRIRFNMLKKMTVFTKLLQFMWSCKLRMPEKCKAKEN